MEFTAFGGRLLTLGVKVGPLGDRSMRDTPLPAVYGLLPGRGAELGVRLLAVTDGAPTLGVKFGRIDETLPRDKLSPPLPGLRLRFAAGLRELGEKLGRADDARPIVALLPPVEERLPKLDAEPPDLAERLGGPDRDEFTETPPPLIPRLPDEELPRAA